MKAPDLDMRSITEAIFSRTSVQLARTGVRTAAWEGLTNAEKDIRVLAVRQAIGELAGYLEWQRREIVRLCRVQKDAEATIERLKTEAAELREKATRAELRAWSMGDCDVL